MGRELKGTETEDPSDHGPGHPSHPALARVDLPEEAGKFCGQRLLPQVLHRIAELAADGHVEVAGELPCEIRLKLGAQCRMTVQQL